jgi:hypothetical protein
MSNIFLSRLSLFSFTVRASHRRILATSAHLPFPLKVRRQILAVWFRETKLPKYH